MLNVMLSSAIALHGIIHLMGFAREWDLAPAGKFSKQKNIHSASAKSKFVGVLWLIACILLLTSAVGYYSEKNWFGIVAICAVVISQALIFVYWASVKWATMANLIILLLIVLEAAKINFKHMVTEEVTTLIAISTEGAEITEEKIHPLPDIIQTWLRKSNVVGTRLPKSIHISQEGVMRTTAESKWLPFDAEQFFTIDPPGFIWTATIRPNKFFFIVGRDKYANGEGNMLIKAASIFTIANSKGKEIDEGSMIRFMAELIWFPQAAVSEYIKWEEIDSTHARITMTYNDVTASGVYAFNPNGFPIGFEAQRYGEFDGKFSKETWSVSTNSYGYFNGIPMGKSSEVTWKLKNGDFTWLQLELRDVQYE